MEKFRKNFPAIVLAMFIAMAVVTWYAVFHLQRRQDLVVTFFDIGQGDAIFIEATNGNQILIDGGPGDRILSKLGRAMPFWDRSIDLLILTHPHADHLDGLLEVLKRYHVAYILESGIHHSIPEYEEWRELLKKKSVSLVTGHTGQMIHAGDGVKLEVLAPFEDYRNSVSKNIHDATVVTKLVYGNTSVLFMGDAEKKLEHKLVFSGIAVDVDILKVGHHGSKTSTSEEFLTAVSPSVAVISAGRKNRYGHPHQDVLDRLTRSGARVLRTDRDHDIRFLSDGINYDIQ